MRTILLRDAATTWGASYAPEFFGELAFDAAARRAFGDGKNACGNRQHSSAQCQRIRWVLHLAGNRQSCDCKDERESKFIHEDFLRIEFHRNIHPALFESEVSSTLSSFPPRTLDSIDRNVLPDHVTALLLALPKMQSALFSMAQVTG